MIKLWILIGIISAVVDALMRLNKEGESILTDKSFYKNAAVQVVGGVISGIWVFAKWRTDIKNGITKLIDWLD